MHFSVTDLPVPEPPMIDEALAGHHREGDAVEHLLGAEGLADVAELDPRRRRRRSVAHQKKASVRR